MDLEFTEIFRQYYASLKALSPKVLTAVLVLLVFFLLGKLFFKVVGSRIRLRWKDKLVSNFVSQAIKWSFYIVGVVIALNVVGFGGVASGLIAGAGVGAIILGFAFKDIGENFLAGFLLALNRPFEIGDIIEVDSFKGTVRDLDLRTTHLRNVEGKDIYLPNSLIVKNTVINYTRDGYLRINFTVGISPECSIDKTRQLILDYLQQQKLILKEPEPNILVKELGEYTVDIQVLFWVDILSHENLPDSLLGDNIRSRAIAEVKTILDANNIIMPSQVLEHKMYGDAEFRIKQ